MRVDIITIGAALFSLPMIPTAREIGPLIWLSMALGIFFLTVGVRMPGPNDVVGDGYAKINALKAQGKKEASRTMARLVNHIEKTNMSINEVFDFFDLNNDGRINHFELESGLNKIGVKKIGPPQITALIMLLDADGNGTIEPEEMRTYLESN